VLRDDDVKPDTSDEKAFTQKGQLFHWYAEAALEDAVITALPDYALKKLIEVAVQEKGEPLISEHLKNKGLLLADLRARDSFSPEERDKIAQCAKNDKAWFKSVTPFERLGYEVIGPAFQDCQPSFKSIVNSLFEWTRKLD
jgi:putative ATP-dependent endonuclease of the OLD family